MGRIAALLIAGIFCPALAFAQQPPTEAGDRSPQAAVTLATPEPATPDAPSALKFGVGSAQAVPEHRITASDKFQIFLKNSVSSETFTEAAINTRLMDDWKSGRFSTTPGYWTRYRTELATSESRALLSKYLLPVAFHQDPRYHRMEQGGVFHRGLYAASRVLFTRADDGSSTINTSHLLGTLGSRTMANTYLPYHDRTLGHTLETTGTVLLSDMGRNLLREFGPDLKARFSGTRLGVMCARFTHKVRTIGVREPLQ
jgi:hypothetical protein